GADAGHFHLQPHPHRSRRDGPRRVPRHGPAAPLHRRDDAPRHRLRHGPLRPQPAVGRVMKVDPHIIFLILIFAAVFTAGQAAIGLVSVATQKRKMNKRLKLAERVDGVSALVMELRKQRGLDAAGERGKRLRWLSNLIVASGLPYDPRKWALYTLAAAMVGGLGAAVALKNPLLFPVGALLVGVGGPIVYLKMMVSKRSKALGFQLPQALEI